MHIHNRTMTIQSMGFYSTGQQERTAAALRSADLRKKLLRASLSLDDDQLDLFPDENLLIRRWLDAHQNPLAADEYTSSDQIPH